MLYFRGNAFTQMFNSCHQLQEKPLGNIDFRAVFPWGEFVGEIGAEIAIKSVADG